ncbi:MAG: SCP2 sterol-binding domain-containing protein [Azoarcus sp.]|jgi:ubiquinone biosynthesis protein UbiJ|nr:SCP2 sterol-binding domain-containing protein [Azoarcus sp.]
MSTATVVCLAAFNHLLGQATWARERLRPHAGRHAHLDLAPFAVAFTIAEDGTFVASPADAAPEVTLTLPLADTLAALGGGLEAVMASARIAGSADLADALVFVFRHLRWDIEEDLAKFIGDIAAHRLVEAPRRLASAATGAFGEETAPLIGRAENERFARDIQALEAGLSKLEEQIGRMKGQGTPD